MRKQSKLLIGIIAAFTVLAVVIITIVMTAVGGSKDTYNSHMELAKRYLDELEYEQAIAEYEAAMQIDPKNEDAYLGLAEVYVAMGDIEKALEVLAECYEQTESVIIAVRQEELAQKSAQVEEDLSEENSGREEQESEAEEEQTGEVVGNESDADTSQMVPSVSFVPWSEAGLEDHVMDWQDKNLEAAMREFTGITDRDIMLSDVWELTELNLSPWPNLVGISLDSLISNISALGVLTNLTSLDLRYNEISDISALSGLTNLTELDLSFNRISDISALSGLTNLTKLDLSSNQTIGGGRELKDISALSGLTNLKYLLLKGNPIEDYSPVEFIEQNGGKVYK